MENQPDLSFYFAVHQAQRDALGRYRDAVSTLTEGERVNRGKALTRWARGFVKELEEHHYVEDAFFFPSLRSKVASAEATLDRLDADHRHLDDLLGRWPAIARALADPTVPFLVARAEAAAFAEELHDFVDGHLTIEDEDVLPLFWRHYTAAEYDAVTEEAIKKGKKAGMWFVAPFCVDCYAEGPDRDAFLASVPGILRLIHRLVRPSYDRLVAEAFGPVRVGTNPAPTHGSSPRACSTR
jgi:hemerythrin-like domain-containing protein